MPKLDIEAIEIYLLLEALFQCYGYDLRDYAIFSLSCRIRKRILAEGLSTISGLQEKIRPDTACMDRLLMDIHQ